ncbi:hypothetical protein KCTCHS21_05530 [Cohnella abietis]|uniref:Uncharacterized protein n=1 Tax=Cohnella abietis TaxID=2507935 RepID=A0A3T1CZ96_9BACL|nr:hypothetical protein KCTCHS21_05530 [Cohnella abietis]
MFVLYNKRITRKYLVLLVLKPHTLRILNSITERMDEEYAEKHGNSSFRRGTNYINSLSSV